MSESPTASGEPVLAWLERRTSLARRRDVEFDDPKLEYRRLFSELWGTFLLVLVAAGGGVVGATAFGGDLTLAMKALAPGMMVMGIIFFMGTISGAHLNPAVTLAFAVRGNFPWRRVPGYILVQVIGAVLASGFLQLVYGGIINGATEPTPDVSLWVAMLTEAVLTLGLVSVILGTASGARNVGINGAIAVGAYIGLVSVWGAPVSGASMNPARSLGPELIAWDLTNYWIYLVGPIIGAMIAVGFEYILKGKANQGRRRSRPRHPRREPPRNLTFSRSESEVPVARTPPVWSQRSWPYQVWWVSKVTGPAHSDAGMASVRVAPALYRLEDGVGKLVAGLPFLRVQRLEDGGIVQEGRRVEVAQYPRTDYIAHHPGRHRRHHPGCGRRRRSQPRDRALGRTQSHRKSAHTRYEDRSIRARARRPEGL